MLRSYSATWARALDISVHIDNVTQVFHPSHPRDFVALVVVCAGAVLQPQGLGDRVGRRFYLLNTSESP